MRWLWLALLVFLADIGIKLFVMDNMGYGWANRIEVLPFFYFLYVHNYGAALAFLVIRRLALVVYGYRICGNGYAGILDEQTTGDEKWNNIAYAIIIGGAVGSVRPCCTAKFCGWLPRLLLGYLPLACIQLSWYGNLYRCCDDHVDGFRKKDESKIGYSSINRY